MNGLFDVFETLRPLGRTNERQNAKLESPSGKVDAPVGRNDVGTLFKCERSRKRLSIIFAGKKSGYALQKRRFR